MQPLHLSLDYLFRIIKSQSAQACDGDLLLLRCPRHSTITIQSAFYGQSAALPGIMPGMRCQWRNHSCSATTALQVSSLCCAFRQKKQKHTFHFTCTKRQPNKAVSYLLNSPMVKTDLRGLCSYSLLALKRYKFSRIRTRLLHFPCLLYNTHSMVFD